MHPHVLHQELAARHNVRLTDRAADRKETEDAKSTHTHTISPDFFRMFLTLLNDNVTVFCVPLQMAT